MKLLKVNAVAAKLELIFLYLPGYASDVTKEDEFTSAEYMGAILDRKPQHAPRTIP